MAPSPVQPFNGQGVRRISPLPSPTSTPMSTGMADGMTGPVHDQMSQSDRIEPDVSPVPNRGTKPKNRNRKFHPGIDLLNKPPNYPRFFIISGEDANLATIDTIRANEDLNKHLKGAPKTINERRDGTLSVEVASAEQSILVASLQRLAGHTVSVVCDDKLNQSRGTIHYSNLPGYSTEKLKESLAPQGVSDIYQMTRRRDGIVEKLQTYILTFKTTNLPTSINIGWTKCSVRLYIPRPRQCLRCFKFGHGYKTCRIQEEYCGKCGKEKHDDNCISPVKCRNCQECHPAYSKNCIFYKNEQEILAIQAKNQIPYHEAKKQVRTTFVRPNVTYSKVVSGSQQDNERPNLTIDEENLRQILAMSSTGTVKPSDKPLTASRQHGNLRPTNSPIPKHGPPQVIRNTTNETKESSCHPPLKPGESAPPDHNNNKYKEQGDPPASQPIGGRGRSRSRSKRDRSHDHDPKESKSKRPPPTKTAPIAVLEGSRKQ